MFFYALIGVALGSRAAEMEAARARAAARGMPGKLTLDTKYKRVSHILR